MKRRKKKKVFKEFEQWMDSVMFQNQLIRIMDEVSDIHLRPEALREFDEKMAEAVKYFHGETWTPNTTVKPSSEITLNTVFGKVTFQDKACYDMLCRNGWLNEERFKSFTDVINKVV